MSWYFLWYWDLAERTRRKCFNQIYKGRVKGKKETSSLLCEENNILQIISTHKNALLFYSLIWDLLSGLFWSMWYLWNTPSLLPHIHSLPLHALHLILVVYIQRSLTRILIIEEQCSKSGLFWPSCCSWIFAVLQSLLDTFVFNQLTSCNLVRALMGQALWTGTFESAFCNFANPKVKSQVEKLPTDFEEKSFVPCYQLFQCLQELLLWLLNGMFLHYKWIITEGERRKNFTLLHSTSTTAMFSLLKHMAHFVLPVLGNPLLATCPYKH